MRQLKIVTQLTNRDDNIDRYFNEVNRIPMINDLDEEADIAYKAFFEKDKVSQNKLVKANLRFVISVAKQFHNKFLSLNDLIDEGNEGLIVASQRFDPTRGVKFISFAVWWIRQRIMEAISNKSETIRIPLNINTYHYKVSKFMDKYFSEFGEMPGRDEIFLAIPILPESFDFEKTNNIRATSSLDAPFEDESGTIMDFISSDNNEEVMKNLESMDNIEEYKQLMIFSDARAKDILIMHFGLDGNPPLSLQSIGDHFDLTRERTRQIKTRALNIMKYRILKRNEKKD